MTRLSPRTRTVLSLLIALLLAFAPAEAGSVGAGDIPRLDEFIANVRNGEAGELRGIYVPGVFASPIVPQPKGDNEFVSSDENTLTQFGLADRFGSTGLLAHNTAAGKHFSMLQADQMFALVYGDGRTETFIVRQILHFRALDPEDSQSLFFDLNRLRLLTAPQLFLDIYAQPGNVILQTCIDANEEPAWGRMFVIAEPYAMNAPDASE